MPVEFMQYPPLENTGVSGDTLFRLTVAYDGSGRRISKTRWVKARGDAGWSREHVTHYTGIGTEIRENMPGGTLKDVRVVVNMPVFFRVTLTRLKPRSYIEKDILRLSNGGAILPKQSFGASRQGLGRYGVEDAADAFRGVPLDENGKPTSWSALNPKFEWYLKNHLGSTMLVYSTAAYDDSYFSNFEGGVKAAYDYRAFGEQIDLVSPSSGKVTENFTGKEKDDETQLNYFGARYLDPMLGLWTSVDPMRQFASPYLYAGYGMNPVNVIDPDGNFLMMGEGQSEEFHDNVTIAIDYLNAYGAAGEIAKLHSQKETVYLVETKGGSYYDANSQTIYWNPHEAYEAQTKLSFQSSFQSVSPALLLVHESAHANHSIDNPSEFDRLGNKALSPDGKFENGEERRTILNSEWPAAKKLGEGLRGSWYGTGFYVSDPTQHQRGK